MDTNNRVLWWKDDPRYLSQQVATLERRHSQRLAHDRTFYRYYYDLPSTFDTMRDSAGIADQMRDFSSAFGIGYNQTAELVDAAVAQVFRPLRANIVPVMAGARIESQCKKLSLVSDAVMESVDFDDVARAALLNAAIASCGWVHVYADDAGKIRVESVDPLSVFWHDDEGEQSVSRYISLAMSREQVIDMAPSKADVVMKLPTWRREHVVGVDFPGLRSDDTVRIDVGYHRADANGKNGRAVTSCGEIILDDRKWAHQFLPLVPIRWKRSLRGLAGVPIARQAAPYHRNVNALHVMALESISGAVPTAMFHTDDEDQFFSDVPFRKIRWSGARKPEITTPNPVSPQLYEQIDRLSEQKYTENGINKFSAAGQRPAGIDSAPAQREYMENSDRRTAGQVAELAGLYRNCSRVILAIAKEVYSDRAMAVRAPGTSLLSEITWEDVDLREDQYQMRFVESSALSKSLAGMFEDIDQLEKRGAMSQAAVTRAIAMRVPDVAMSASRSSAGEDLANQIVSDALERGAFTMPPSIDATCVEATARIGAQEWLISERRSNRTEQEVVFAEVLRRVVLAAERKKQPPSQPPAAEPAAPPMPADPMAAAAPAPMPPEPLPPEPMPMPQEPAL